MSQGKQATIGDALIFMTKALFAVIALMIVAGTAYAFFADRNEARQKLIDASFQIVKHEATIAELGHKLNECLVRTDRAPSGVELKRLITPREGHEELPPRLRHRAALISVSLGGQQHVDGVGSSKSSNPASTATNPRPISVSHA